MSRSGVETGKAIESALVRLEYGRGKKVKGNKISIAAVAKEAGVSNATIHNRHPDIADKIRVKQGKEARKRLNDKNEALKKAKENVGALREEVKELKKDLVKLASINATLISENKLLKAMRDSNNITEFRRK